MGGEFEYLQYGVASSANGLWMMQIARNLTDDVDGFFFREAA